VACWACATSPYGFIQPGDPQYGFGYPKPETRDLIGLAAKGNIIIGDYTSKDFRTKVLPHLTPKTMGNPKGKTQPYIIDPTDAPLGYHDAGFMTGLDGQSRPKFSGNYDQQDQANGLPAIKRNLDGTEAVDGEGTVIPRNFYESSLPDEAFKKIIDTNRNGLIDQGDDAIFNTSAVAKVDAVLFTNHALAGKVYADRLDLDGSLIARDDALIFGNKLVINHDQRLVNSQINQAVVLPFTITRPRLVGVRDCPPSGCAALP